VNSFNPNIHHRRSIRLKRYDYSQAGAYFITICCQDRINRFGNIIKNEMILNEYGLIAYNEWVNLSERFSNFELDVFQIMPNHMHGIIVLNHLEVSLADTPDTSPLTDTSVRVYLADTPDTSPLTDTSVRVSLADTPDTSNNLSDKRAGASPAPAIFDIVGAYKSLVANGCLGIYKSKNETMGKLWQRNYYEHIIRNEQSYQNISNYIVNNPSKWEGDKFYI
jgi:REP element-mobilizing transposase RayT